LRQQAVKVLIAQDRNFLHLIELADQLLKDFLIQSIFELAKNDYDSFQF
jgi:hypothetical protein